MDDVFGPEGHQGYGHAMAEMVRRGQAEAAAERLSRDIAAVSPELWEVCGTMPLEVLRLNGWEELNTSLGAPHWADLTAIRISMTAGLDPITGEPCVQITGHKDDDFPFSTASQNEIVAAIQDGGFRPGSSEAIGAAVLSVEGMALLHGMIEEEKARNDPPEPGSQASNALFLADWWRAVQFHQLVHREMARMGLDYPVVVLVGAMNCGPDVESVIVPDRPIVAPVDFDLADDTSAPMPILKPAAMTDYGATGLPSFSVVELRRKLATAVEEDVKPAKTGLLARFFARR
ncbi:MAG: hypothetical protein K2X59_04165 [Sphingomonas sp.]|nr:hypothetical protein [Sphingomonas sp.]